MQLKQTPINPLSIPELTNQDISLFVKRDDLQHEVVSGNKLFKLFYHLQYCQKNEIETILTFGGAYSNHLHATAYAAQKMGIKSVAIVRGEQLLPLNPTLKDCTDWGMVLEPVSRVDYKQKQDSESVQHIIDKYKGAHVIPEGGCDLMGVQGAAKMLDGVDQSEYDYIVCPCGTGTTLAGIVSKAAPHITVLGIAVLKGAQWMEAEVEGWLNQMCHQSTPRHQAAWRINTDYHFGGYGKIKPELLEFIKMNNVDYDLPLEPIYTAKAMYGVLDMIQKGLFEKGSRILFIHTGGLQGHRS